MNRLAHVKSLSARRAWIEMLADTSDVEAATVALRKESVDRNFDTMQIVIIIVESLSARRAWIEIEHVGEQFRVCGCRSPQGERG